MLDGNARQNLATFCQTWEEPEIHQLMDDRIDKNMVDKDEYPQTAEIEARCVHMLADLWHSPAQKNAVGCSTTGSSEAAMLGGMAMKRRWEVRRRAAGRPADKPNLITGPVQICWHKPRVKSINAPGHKFGLAPLGVGWVLWRDTEDLPEDLVFWVNYLGGNMRDIALNFSRPGGQVACQYYNFLRLGREGFGKVHGACYDTARYLAREIGNLGPFEIIYGGEAAEGIPALCWPIREGMDSGFSLYDLADRLRAKGWQVPAYSLPVHCESEVIQRILVRHGVSRDLASMLLRDMRDAVRYFEKHPIQVPMDATEASGFHH